MRRLLASPLVFCATLVVLIAPLMAWTAFSHGGSDTTIAMRGYDLNRTGANLQEKILNTSNVNVNAFGKIFTRTVDGQIYAQPLYVPEVDMGASGVHNVVFVATEKNNVYAFDADDPAASTPLWTVNLGAQGVSADREFGTRYHNGLYTDIQPYVGITSTPAIDLSTQTIYIVTFVKVASNNYKHELHALDMTTGADKTGSPVRIQGSVPGNGAGNDGNGNVVFNSQKQLQRPGIALANGKLYVAFAGYADTDPYHGWIFSYDAQTLQRRAIYNVTPNGGYPGDPDTNGGEGGIWQSGQAPAIDADGNVYVITGNGTSDSVNGNDLGTAFVKLDGNTLTPLDWFMPFDYQTLNTQDADIGSSGAVLLPNTNLVIGGGKKGKIYVVDRSNMGHFHAGNDSQIVQNFQATVSHIHGSIVYWNSANGPRIYVWGEQDKLKSYALKATGTFSTTAVASGSTTLAAGMPGGILAISASGNDTNTGIVWATHPRSGDANTGTRPGILRAYRADTLAELWNSELNAGRDRVGNFAKFNPPTIADGRVFVGDFALNNDPPGSDHLVVYGLLAPSIVNNIEDVSIVTGETATLNVNATGAGPLSYQWYQGNAGDTSNPIAGATARSYTTPPLHTETPYWARVTNGYDSIDSETARVITTKVASATDLMPAAGSTVFGQSAIFTATVSGPAPDGSTPTGSVTFKAGSVVLGSATLDASGTASFSTSALAVGSHLVTAFYSGDDTFTLSNSSPQAHTVTKAATTTSLSSAPATSAVAGQSVTLQASVVADASSGMPGGSITFSDGTALLGSAPVQADGTATWNTVALGSGAHTLTAQYTGDEQHQESSATLAYTVGDAPIKDTTYVVMLPMMMR